MLQPEPDKQLLGPPWGVADFLMIVLGGYVAVLVAGVLLMGTELSPSALVVVSALATSVGQIGGVVAILQRRKGRLSDLGFEVEGGDGVFLFLGAGLQFLMAIAFQPLAEAVESDGTTQAVADSIASAQQLTVKIAIMVLVGLVAPIMEELAFRGVLLSATRRRIGPVWAAVVTAVVFSLFHTLGIQQDNWLAGLITLLQLLIAGLVLAALTIRRGRLGPAIFTHAGFNLVTLMILFSGISLEAVQ